MSLGGALDWIRVTAAEGDYQRQAVREARLPHQMGPRR
jgi:hypothetical protein